MDQSKALDKIKKCLRLAASDSPNEAAAALRQARALMEKFGIGQADVAMADVHEHGARSGSKINPPIWEAGLANTVASAYACKIIFVAGRGDWSFIGEAAEVAAYAMTVLLRQVRQARRDFIGNHLKRCKPATKTKRADVFCNAWVWSVRRKVQDFASATPSAAVAAYIERHHPELTTGAAIDRNAGKGKALSARSLNDAAMGICAADGVRLNHGVDGESPLALT